MKTSPPSEQMGSRPVSPPDSQAASVLNEQAASHVFASQAAQEIQQFVVSNQQKQDLAHSSNRELSTLTGGTPTVSKVSEEELGESLGDEVGNGAEQKRKKLTKAQVRELEGFWQAGYTGAPSGRPLVAAQLGVAERQVAIWFQNRRARQRSKQMTQEFDLLKRDFRLVLMENKKMQQELSELRAELARSTEQTSDRAILTFPKTKSEAASASHPRAAEACWQQALMQASQALELSSRALLGEPQRAPQDVEVSPRASLHHLEGFPLPPSKRARLEAQTRPYEGFQYESNEQGMESANPSSGLLDSVIGSLNPHSEMSGREAMLDFFKHSERLQSGNAGVDDRPVYCGGLDARPCSPRLATRVGGQGAYMKGVETSMLDYQGHSRLQSALEFEGEVQESINNGMGIGWLEMNM